MPRFFDSLTNLISGLGTAKDKSTATTFALKTLTRGDLDAMYRSDWLARKIIDIIPFDMTREWRNWQAEEDQIEKIEATEKRLGMRDKVATALQRARLYGGSAIYIGTKDPDVSKPLDFDRIGKDGVTYLHVLTAWEVTTGLIDRDPMSPTFGEPEYYDFTSVSKGAVRVHPSRIVRFVGVPLPDPLSMLAPAQWGDPVLQIVYDAVMNAGSTQAHVASLLPELKTDVISVPGLQNALATEDGTNKLIGRFTKANLLKSMNNMLLLQGGEDKVAEKWEQRQINFTEFPELLRIYLQIAAGAADIPATRLLGQAPAGLNATGDADTRNYYDNVAAKQKVDLAPRIERIDECLIRSALGSRPAGVYYEFAPLWQMSETEKADIAFKLSQTVANFEGSGLVPSPVLEAGLRNRLIEDGPFPGIEAAYELFDAGKLEVLEPDDDDDEDDPPKEVDDTRPFDDAGFDPDQPRDKTGKWTATIDDVIAAAGKNEVRRTEVGKPNATVIAGISELHGIDATGFDFTLTNHAVQHILGQHGVVSEGGRGQIPITAEDFRKLPTILPLVNKVAEARSYPNSKRARLYATVEAGQYTMIVVAQTGKRRIELMSMWRK